MYKQTIVSITPQTSYSILPQGGRAREYHKYRIHRYRIQAQFGYQKSENTQIGHFLAVSQRLLRALVGLKSWITRQGGMDQANGYRRARARFQQDLTKTVDLTFVVGSTTCPPCGSPATFETVIRFSVADLGRVFDPALFLYVRRTLRWSSQRFEESPRPRPAHRSAGLYNVVPRDVWLFDFWEQSSLATFFKDMFLQKSSVATSLKACYVKSYW